MIFGKIASRQVGQVQAILCVGGGSGGRLAIDLQAIKAPTSSSEAIFFLAKFGFKSPVLTEKVQVADLTPSGPRFERL